MSDNPEETAYYLRLISMYIDLGTETVVKVFYRLTPKQNVKIFFSSPDIQSALKSLSKNKVLSCKEYKLVLYNPNPEKFDISLLVTLLTNLYIGKLPAPNNGWTSPSDSQDFSIAADLLRLRYIRNTVVAHQPRARLFKVQFDNLWKRAEDILLRLIREVDSASETILKERISAYKDRPLDPQNDGEQEYLEKLRDWWENCEEISKLQEQVENLVKKTQEFVLFFKTKPERYSRYIKLLFDGGRLVLSGQLVSEVSKQTETLEMILRSNQDFLKEKLSSEQMYKQLFQGTEENTIINTNIETWDITALAIVIISVFSKSVDEVTLTHVSRIMEAVNDYAKTALTSLDSDLFTSCCEDLLSSILVLSCRLGNDIYKKCNEVIEIYKKMSDSNSGDVDHYFEELRSHGSEIKTIAVVYKETVDKLKDSVKQMEKDGIAFKREHVLELKMVTLGNNEEKKKVAEDTLEILWQAALKTSKNPEEFEAVRQALDIILNDIRRIPDVKVEQIERHCILLRLRCFSWRGLLLLIEYFNSSDFERHLKRITGELRFLYNDVLVITGKLTAESILDVLRNLECPHDEPQQFISLPIQCTSAEGMRQVLDIVGKGSTINLFNEIAESLSEQVGGKIFVSVSSEVGGFSDVFEEEESEHSSSNSLGDDDDTVDSTLKTSVIPVNKPHYMSKNEMPHPDRPRFSTDNQQAIQPGKHDLELYLERKRSKVMLRLARKCNIPDQKQKIDDIKDKQLDLVTEEMRTIRAVDPETKEAYYHRLHLLIVKEGTAILKARFDHSVPPQQLYVELQQCMKTFNYAKKNNLLSRTQFSNLFPQYNPPSSDTFDLSLLVYLLRNVCGLKSNSNWWNENDNSKIPDLVVDEEADIVRLRNLRHQMQQKQVASLEQVEFETMWDLAEKVLLRLATKCNILDQKQKIDDIKDKQLDLVTEEMRSIRANTELFFQDYQDDDRYVETSAYQKAKTILEDKNIIILTGHPGEGKTTMAARLALDMSQPRNCVKLVTPSDWRKIDLSLKLFDTVIIDDIFGAGALDQKLVGDWRIYLTDIERAAKKKALRVIITSRHYIFEEFKKELGFLPMFKDENETVILLTSSELTHVEKTNILKIQAEKNQKHIKDRIIFECVEASKGPTEVIDDFLFGFPECASMFVRNENMLRKGADIFKKPASHYKKYLDELYRGKEKDKFLALVAVWAKENKRLSRDELRTRKTSSDHIKRIAEIFDHDLDKRFLETMRLSLDSHVGGYLVFSEATGEYAFSHNVIGDMVGLVIGKKKPEEAVEICPRDFLMEYISIGEAVRDDFKVNLKERQFYCLVEKCSNMILRKNCNTVAETPTSDKFQTLQRTRQRNNAIKIINTIDFGIITHKAFSSEKFVKEFIDYVVQEDLVNQIFSVPVMRMNGYFLNYGISMKQLDMCLMGYAWYSGAIVFAKEVITRRIVEEENADSSVPLLLAAHSKQKESVEFLLKHGAKVTGDAIYIAMHKSTELLNLFLQHPETDVNDRGNAINGNFPLIVAARKGLTSAVRCMLNSGADPRVQNIAKMTALHKAILYKQEDVIEMLVEAGAPLNIKGGQFKRTPLHLAVDLENTELVKLLLSKHASLTIKDHRGHYPIHIAAIRGNVQILRELYVADRTQDKLRISPHGAKSVMKGMSLFHIAIWKKNEELLNALIDLGADPNIQDFYGQTPLFFAIMKKREDCIRKLLHYKQTDKSLPQHQGFTPLQAAIYKNLDEIAKQLAKYSDVNLGDKYGKNPLCEKAKLELIRTQQLPNFQNKAEVVIKMKNTRLSPIGTPFLIHAAAFDNDSGGEDLFESDLDKSDDDDNYNDFMQQMYEDNDDGYDTDGIY